MNIEELTINNPQWDDFVINTKGYNVHYLSDYLKAFMEINQYEPIMFCYRDGNEQAINIFFKRDIAKEKNFQNKIEQGKYFDLISPYGYGGYVGNCLDEKKLWRCHHEYCMSRGYVCEVIKFHPLSKYKDYYCGEIKSTFHNVVRGLEDEIEKIWMDFKPKVRKNVKRAQKNELAVIVEHDASHLEDFQRIYYGTMSRTNAKDSFFFSKAFFEQLNQMRENIVYFYVVYKEHIISAELVLYDAISCYSYLGGTDSDYFELRPNDFLKYEIIKWGKKKGLKNYILGGGHGKDDGIFQYKLSFAPHGIVDFCVGTDMFCGNAYDMLCEIRKQEEQSFTVEDKIFPAYRF